MTIRARRRRRRRPAIGRRSCDGVPQASLLLLLLLIVLLGCLLELCHGFVAIPHRLVTRSIHTNQLNKNHNHKENRRGTHWYSTVEDQVDSSSATPPPDSHPQIELQTELSKSFLDPFGIEGFKGQNIRVDTLVSELNFGAGTRWIRAGGVLPIVTQPQSTEPESTTAANGMDEVELMKRLSVESVF